MKQAYFLFSSLCGLFVLMLLIFVILTPNKAIVGPHNIHDWASNEIITFPKEVYHLAGDEDIEPMYFEISQNTGGPIQSKYQEPELGKKHGQYTIEEVGLEGSWKISGSAHIWADKDIIVLVDIDQGTKIFLCIAAFIVFWLFIILMAEIFLW